MQNRSVNGFRLAILGALACFSAGESSAQARDEALEIGLSCERSSDSIALTMTFRNTGSNDTALFIGSILGNGSKYLASELAVELGSASGNTRFGYSDPSIPGIAGRLDVWVVGLPAGSSFSITRPWDHFSASGEPLLQARAPLEVRARLDAREVPGAFPIPKFRAFAGELVSEWISVPDDCL